MTDVASIRPAVGVLLPALAVVAILLSRRRPRVREACTLLAAAAQAVVVASLVPGVLRGVVYETTLGGLVPGIQFALRADGLGVLFALVASALWLITSVYNVGYTRLREEHAQTRYFASFAATLSAAAGVAFGGNLLTLFVFYELLTVATYPLVTHRGTEAARRAGRTYVLYTVGGGILVFAGTVLVFELAGSTAFTPGGIAELATADPVVGRVAFGLLVGGFGVKAALMPLHSWLPKAMVAPTPVSGLLHAVAVVKSGVFGIARVVLDVYGVDLMQSLELGLPLAVVAAVTTLAASLFALKQTNLKRLLAYSTVSQLSYVVLGLAVLHPNALFGGVFHVPAHAVTKLVLFLCAGTIYAELHVDEVDAMAGIGRLMPVTAGAFAVAAMGMIGIPFTAGFVSKLYLVVGSFDAGFALFAVVLVANTVLKIAYFWPIVYGSFFETPEAHDPKPILAHPIGGYWGGGDVRADGTGSAHLAHSGGGAAPVVGRWRLETSPLLLGPIVLLAALSVLLGLVPDAVGLEELIRVVVDAATGGGR